MLLLRIGLTGGIASGKSTVLRRLAAAGLETLDLDHVAHGLMAPGEPAYDEVVAAFGPGILAPDGTIDRGRLGSLVFSNPQMRERLNRIVHPRVRAEEAARARALASRPGAALVTDAALLVEAGLHARFDRLVVVHCPAEQQVERLRERDGLTTEAARARLLAQMPSEAKRRFAHFTIDTSSSRARTEAAADALARALVELAARPRAPQPVARESALGALLHGPARGPRGLTPILLAQHLARAPGLELASLARLMKPAPSVPWYEAGASADAPSVEEPSALVAPLALLDVARRGHDPERLAAAAFSLAWLTERDPGRLSSAVFVALLVGETAAHGRLPADVSDPDSPRLALARRWGGGEVGREVRTAAEAAARHPADPRAAREACAAAGVEPGLGGALAALLAGAAPADPAPADELEAFLASLLAVDC